MLNNCILVVLIRYYTLQNRFVNKYPGFDVFKLYKKIDKNWNEGLVVYNGIVTLVIRVTFSLIGPQPFLHYTLTTTS